jgi:DNA-binding MarR family transcriptional regulator
MRPIPGDAFSVEEFVPYQFALLSSRLSRSLALTCASFDLSLSEWRLMAIIASGNSLSASDVSERSTMDAVAVHRAVKSLSERRLISRMPVDSDRRIKRLSLTAKGRDAYEAVTPAARKLERDLLSVLSPAETKDLRRIMRRLVERGIP